MSFRSRQPAPSNVLIAAICAVAVCCGSTASGQTIITAETLTDEHVHQAVRALVQEIYDRKHPERFWEPTQGTGDGSEYQVGGYTALATLALLYAGESYQNPILREVVDHLQQRELQGTYSVAVRTAVWAILPPRFQQQLEQDAQWLMDGFSPAVGGWAYYKNPTTERRDNSLRHFGALAWWEASKRGLRVQRESWQALERGYLDMQLADGGWSYQPQFPRSTGSMTAAGLVTLFITQDFLHARDALELDRAASSDYELAIEHGLAWMDEHFTVSQNPGRNQYFYYYLYSVERAALASGYKYFGGKDWYREGAAELIRRFCAWDPETRTMTMHEVPFGGGDRRTAFRIEELAFGLMFLTRGYAPPVINKLRDPASSWNNRPRDAANLTFWLAEQTARHLFWQIVDIDAPPVEWLDAPLVYFASHTAVPWVRDIDVNVPRYVQQWRANERRKALGQPESRDRVSRLPSVPELDQIREYLERGGLLLAVQEGNGRAFAESIEKFGQLLFPQYEWRTLSPDHWAYTAHQPVRGSRPRGHVLSNGVRDLIVLITDQDITATFQIRRTSERAHYDTVSNVYFYASEMNRPRSRLRTLGSDDDFLLTGATLARDRPVSVVRGMYIGNWNPEPEALELFADALHRSGDLSLTLSSQPLARIHELTPRPTIVIVTGTDEHRFSREEREAIRNFVEGGGVILFETAGGRGNFALSAETQLAAVFDRPAQPLLRDAVITGEGLEHALDCSSLDYRPFSLQVLGAIDTTPRLRGMMFDGMPRVLFSREDLSHALLDQPCWGIYGYSPRSAKRLVRNILLMAGASRRDR